MSSFYHFHHLTRFQTVNIQTLPVHTADTTTEKIKCSNIFTSNELIKIIKVANLYGLSQLFG